MVKSLLQTMKRKEIPCFGTAAMGPLMPRLSWELQAATEGLTSCGERTRLEMWSQTWSPAGQVGQSEGVQPEKR